MDTLLILNHLILLAKFYIYKCKLDIKHPSLNVFIAKIRATLQIEQKIASNNDNLHLFHSFHLVMLKQENMALVLFRDRVC